jgi:serine/threonine-protein kinase HipA
MPERTIHVHAHWAGMHAPAQMGLLHIDRVRGQEMISFEYDRDWLERPGLRSLDPALQFFTGPQYPRQGSGSFGIFSDSAPDRWGRMLMQRREAQLARMAQRRPRLLSDTDYLLGVTDITRMGGLRFSAEPQGPFLSESPLDGVPPMTRLRELEQAAFIAEDEDAPLMEQDTVLALLLAPGSSLGGARPKANVLDVDDSLWIAKFPSRGDTVDKGAWEKVVHDLAQKCGIEVPSARTSRFSVHGQTFLSKRFDRTSTGERVHFASAMTMLQRKDGDNAESGASYLEIAEFLMRHGSRTEEDLHQLWGRIVFNICVSNTDDHLRNHGFLLAEDGWVLSPAYDLNPEPASYGLSLNIDEVENTLSLTVAIDAAPYFRLNKDKAKERALSIAEVVGKNWRLVALDAGIKRNAVERMSPAFVARP